MKTLLIVILITASASAYWQTQCDEDANCKQVWISE